MFCCIELRYDSQENTILTNIFGYRWHRYCLIFCMCSGCEPSFGHMFYCIHYWNVRIETFIWCPMNGFRQMYWIHDSLGLRVYLIFEIIIKWMPFVLSVETEETQLFLVRVSQNRPPISPLNNAFNIFDYK